MPTPSLPLANCSPLDGGYAMCMVGGCDIAACVQHNASRRRGRGTAIEMLEHTELPRHERSQAGRFSSPRQSFFQLWCLFGSLRT